MATALIIGASRGIGLEMVRQYRADGWRVIATVRRPDQAGPLALLGAEVHALDVTSLDDCATLGWKLDDERLDVALLCAGVAGPASMGPSTPTAAEFDLVMHSNVLAAMRLLPIVAPLVASVRGRLAVLSSAMGSIGRRENPSYWLYRASKAALNSVLADIALACGPQGATCVSLHPGWVQTDMGGANADLTPQQSVAALRATLAALTPAANGQFLNYDGANIPW